MNILDSLLDWIVKITQAVVVLIPLAVVLNILFGNEIGFVGKVVENLIGLLNSFAAQGVIGLVGLGIVIWLFARIYKSDGNGVTEERQAPPISTGGG